TGRARQGSTRSPQWSGGGVALGPKPRSYRQRTPKKMIRLALYSALSDRASDGKVVVVDEWSFPAPRTKDAVAALAALELDGRVLVVLDPDDGIPDRSFANLREVQTMQASELNAYDVLRSDWVVFTDATLPGETTPAATKPAATPKPRRAPKAKAPAGEADDAVADDAVPGDAVAADAITDEADAPTTDPGTDVDDAGSDR
ncbi:MAG TPA: 50S ribosomal protein L4, partial [Acidimicrobiales bacterium]